MARYIDVEPLEEKLKEHIKKTESELMLGALSTFLRVLDITPTADAVPVVRCKDCKYWGEVGTVCRKLDNVMFWYGTDPTDFCSFAERRDDE